MCTFLLYFLSSQCAVFVPSFGSSRGLFTPCGSLYLPFDPLSRFSACFRSFRMLSSPCSLLALNPCNVIFSTTSFLILLYSVSHCVALRPLFIVPPGGEAFFFVPKLGSCRNTRCVLFGTHRTAEHRVGASYTPGSSLWPFQEPVRLASRPILSSMHVSFCVSMSLGLLSFLEEDLRQTV